MPTIDRGYKERVRRTFRAYLRLHVRKFASGGPRAGRALRQPSARPPRQRTTCRRPKHNPTLVGHALWCGARRTTGILMVVRVKLLITGTFQRVPNE